MKIIWFTGMLFPQVAKQLNRPVPYSGGWLIGQLSGIDPTENDVYICSVTEAVNETTLIEAEGYHYVLIPQAASLVKNEFSNLISAISPDVIHVQGTETEEALEAMLAAPPEKTVVSVQGLVSVCALHMFDGLPAKYCSARPMKRWISRLLAPRMDVIAEKKAQFEKIGVREQRLFQAAKHVIGRTEWDRACVQQINPQAKYYFCMPTLRNAFYSGERWSASRCRPHSILVSQAFYPIKGFHMLLKAAPLLLADYPDLHIYVAGHRYLAKTDSVKLPRFIKAYFREYWGYVDVLIQQAHLQDHITYLGPLDGEGMKEQLLRSNVFVSASSIENESNSVCEAMMLGVPVVSSYVGGVRDMIEHGKDGYLYPFAEYNMMAFYIRQVFSQPEEAAAISANAIESAKARHNPEANAKALMDIYKCIAAQS